MNLTVRPRISWIALSVTLALGCAHSSPPPAPRDLPLEQGWAIQSSAVATAGGAAISSPQFDAASWVSTSVPSTVVAALIRSGAVPDPFAGRNLETMPTEPYRVPWWYRTEFSLDAVPADGRLLFEGINYSAEIWLNGERIAGPEQITGAFRVFELDVGTTLRIGTNVLAVQVFPPRPGDPTIGFVDWNPPSPDRYMGLFRPVTLKMTSGVSLEDVYVRGEVDPKNLGEARISVGAEVENRTRRRATALVRGRIGPDVAIGFEREVTLEPGEKRQLRFGASEFPQLALASPRLWWPVNMGDPNLYSLELEAVTERAVSDTFETHFGIRHVADYLNAEGHRGYAINGKPVLIRGGGWVDDLFLIEDPQRLEDQIRYVRHMNLNTIRLEGFWGSTQALYDLADRYGVMVWVGWSCQWEWDNYLGQPVDETFGGIDTPAEMDLIVASLHDQVVRLRNHPSIVVWNLASDMLPRPDLEARYRAELQRIDPTRPPLAACSTRTSEVSGPTGVKMNGPYEWVPPNYWYDKAAPGGAFGFNTETGPGAQPPVAGSIRRMLPESSWWPIDAMWNYHAARAEFKNLDRYRAALDARYGPSDDLEEFALKAQMASYEAMRGMFEAFSLRRPVATGVVQWMMNGAWPKMFWQLYDYYLMPTGAFYAARNSGRPVHVAMDYGTREIVAVNDTASALEATAHVRVFDASSRVLLDERRPLSVRPGTRHSVLTLPDPLAPGLHFVDARILGPDGALLGSNVYWLPARPDVLDWEHGEWFYTPTKEFADMKAVDDLPEADLQVAHRFVPSGDDIAIEVTLSNPGPHLAFFLELEVAGRQSGALATPIFWEDNYVSLAPGETRTVRGTVPARALNGEDPALRWQGINVGGNR